jgi:hypothetical protein
MIIATATVFADMMWLADLPSVKAITQTPEVAEVAIELEDGVSLEDAAAVATALEPFSERVTISVYVVVPVQVRKIQFSLSGA